jgi:hypothetical protein
MDSNTPRRRAETWLEFALYAGILGMTVSCVFMYKTLSGDRLLSSFTKYLGFAYVAFLALAFGQLNTLHRKRKAAMPAPAPKPVKMPEPVRAVRPVKAPERPWRPPLGLTITQFAIVAFVFVTACVTFTWALSILH